MAAMVNPEALANIETLVGQGAINWSDPLDPASVQQDQANIWFLAVDDQTGRGIHPYGTNGEIYATAVEEIASQGEPRVAEVAGQLVQALDMVREPGGQGGEAGGMPAEAPPAGMGEPAGAALPPPEQMPNDAATLPGGVSEDDVLMSKYSETEGNPYDEYPVDDVSAENVANDMAMADEEEDEELMRNSRGAIQLNSFFGSGGLPVSDKRMVIPVGEIRGRDKRSWKLSKDEASDLVQRIREDNVDVVLDYNHGSYAGDPKAAGWFPAGSFEARDDGIYAALELTPNGRQIVENREFRYISPAFYSSMDEPERITSIDSFGLTNLPNITVIPSLNSRRPGGSRMNTEAQQGKTAPETNGKSREELVKNNKTMWEDNKKLVLQVNKMKDDVATMRKKVEMLENVNNQLIVENTRLHGTIEKDGAEKRRQLVVNAVDEAIKEGRLAKAQRDSMVSFGMLDFDKMKEAIEAANLNLNELSKETSPPEGAEEGAALNGEILSVCNMMSLDKDKVAETARKLNMNG